MFQTINIYDSMDMYFRRNGLKRNDNMRLHDPVIVFLAEYNVICASSSDIEIPRYDHMRNCLIPIQNLNDLIDNITYDYPLIGNNIVFHNGFLHINPTIFLGKILKSKVRISYSRFFGNNPRKPTPVMCWLYNHNTGILSAILTSSKSP